MKKKIIRIKNDLTEILNGIIKKHKKAFGELKKTERLDKICPWEKDLSKINKKFGKNLAEGISDLIEMNEIKLANKIIRELLKK